MSSDQGRFAARTLIFAGETALDNEAAAHARTGHGNLRTVGIGTAGRRATIASEPTAIFSQSSARRGHRPWCIRVLEGPHRLKHITCTAAGRRSGPSWPEKIHIWIGDVDTYYLNDAVYLLEDFSRPRTLLRGPARSPTARATPLLDGAPLLNRALPGDGAVCRLGRS
jgi:hypothetical protein